MAEIFLPGVEGRLHGAYVQQRHRRAALILPPYPKYGGSMNNRVVHMLYQSFIANKFSTLKINFRGVQKSDGKISSSDSEFIKDASAAINWLQDHNPIISEFWIAGFSFGAWMATNLIMRRPETTGFIAISPPVERYDFSFLLPCLVPGLIIQGDNDRITDHTLVEKLAEKLQSKVKSIKYHCISGGNYKFSDINHVQEIKDVSSAYISDIVNFSEEKNNVMEYKQLEEAEA
ncbi:MAG: alpha/beta hydrolase [Rickettsiaceae bacterium H1]|nr:alpha/beta hydrolase [Rickettsiaceae bacterium H1]